MLAVLTSNFGFLAPFLPEIIKHFNAKVANAHELAMLTLQGQIYLFTFLDFVAGITRPGISWAVFGLYAATNYAQVWSA